MISNDTVLQAVGRIDDDGSRYLLGDYLGQMYLLALVHDDSSVISLQLEPLGRINPPATLSYLDNGVVFVGSTCGDSQLVSAGLLKRPCPFALSYRLSWS